MKKKIKSDCCEFPDIPTTDCCVDSGGIIKRIIVNNSDVVFDSEKNTMRIKRKYGKFNRPIIIVR